MSSPGFSGIFSIGFDLEGAGFAANVSPIRVGRVCVRAALAALGDGVGFKGRVLGIDSGFIVTLGV